MYAFNWPELQIRAVIAGLRDLGECGRASTPGTGVVLVMARGMTHKWKLPIAYYIVNKSVTSTCIVNIIVNSVTKLLNLGLDVKATVCDQGKQD